MNLHTDEPKDDSTGKNLVKVLLVAVVVTLIVAFVTFFVIPKNERIIAPEQFPLSSHSELENPEV